jgi:hypothetical protein
VSKDGQVISRECDTCHTLLGQEEGGGPMAQMAGVGFQHPGGEMDFASINCDTCHSGGPQ